PANVALDVMTSGPNTAVAPSVTAITRAAHAAPLERRAHAPLTSHQAQNVATVDRASAPTINCESSAGLSCAPNTRNTAPCVAATPVPVMSATAGSRIKRACDVAA